MAKKKNIIDKVVDRLKPIVQPKKIKPVIMEKEIVIDYTKLKGKGQASGQELNKAQAKGAGV